MPRGQRSPDQRSVSFSCARALVDQIDELAASEKRTRSNWIVKELEEMVRRKTAAKITMMPAERAAEEATKYRAKRRRA